MVRLGGRDHIFVPPDTAYKVAHMMLLYHHVHRGHAFVCTIASHGHKWPYLCIIACQGHGWPFVCNKLHAMVASGVFLVSTPHPAICPPSKFIRHGS